VSDEDGRLTAVEEPGHAGSSILDGAARTIAVDDPMPLRKPKPERPKRGRRHPKAMEENDRATQR
jgi:hypothetical protein